MPTINKPHELIKITDDGLVRVDGIGAFRRIERDGVIYLQFADYDRMRITCRGSRYVEIPLNVLVEKIYLKGNDNGNGQQPAA